MSRDQQQQLHSRAQEMLRCHVITSTANQRRQQHRDALIAQLDMDASLLLSTCWLSAGAVLRGGGSGGHAPASPLLQVCFPTAPN